MSGIERFDRPILKIIDGHATVPWHPLSHWEIDLHGGRQLGGTTTPDGRTDAQPSLPDLPDEPIADQRPYDTLTYLDDPDMPWITKPLNIPPRRFRGVWGRVLAALWRTS